MTNNDKTSFAPELLARTEALLFAAGSTLSCNELATLLEMSETEVEELLAVLSASYESLPQCSLELRRVENSYGLSIKAAYRDWVAQLYRPGYQSKLSTASYETLAAILYNQPATRAQVELVRGVNSDGIIARLEERGLVEECGVLEQPGRPSVFRVSTKFMLEMGIGSVEELKPTELLMYETIRNLEEGGEGEE